MDYEITYVQKQLSAVWPNWRISRKLGKGSYGNVYEILRDDLGTQYTCALKVLQMEAQSSGGYQPAAAGFAGSAGQRQKAGAKGSQGSPASGSQGSLQSSAGQRQNAHSQGSLLSSAGQKQDARSQGSLQASTGQRRNAHSQGSLAQDTAQSRIDRKTVWNSSGESSGMQPPPPDLLFGDISGSEIEEFIHSVSSEIDLMMQLKGVPNIVTIEDYAILRDNNTCTILIRMEELEPLDSFLRRRKGSLQKEEIIRLGTDICSALTFCEQKNILHRDIKTSNLFYSNEAGFKLGDFGISRSMASIREKAAMSGIGTIQYMAPEIYQGREYNNTADIYSLGIVLYILANGMVPPLYDSGTGRQTAFPLSRAQVHEANMRRLRGEVLPPPRYTDPLLASVICAACNPAPESRFQTAGAFRQALLSSQQDIRQSVPQQPGAQQPVYQQLNGLPLRPVTMRIAKSHHASYRRGYFQRVLDDAVPPVFTFRHRTHVDAQLTACQAAHHQQGHDGSRLSGGNPGGRAGCRRGYRAAHRRGYQSLLKPECSFGHGGKPDGERQPGPGDRL